MTMPGSCCVYFFFFNDTATTEIYTLSLHDALPISRRSIPCGAFARCGRSWRPRVASRDARPQPPPLHDSRCRRRGLRSEEHTSELQSRQYLVCRLLLEKKKKNDNHIVDFSEADLEY